MHMMIQGVALFVILSRYGTNYVGFGNMICYRCK